MVLLYFGLTIDLNTKTPLQASKPAWNSFSGSTTFERSPGEEIISYTSLRMILVSMKKV